MTTLATSDWLMIASGCAGLVSALLMAIPALFSIDSRATLIKLSELKLIVVDQKALMTQEQVLLGKALKELRLERRCLHAGLALLALAFALSIAGTATATKGTKAIGQATAAALR